ncbi:hypothetical protein ATANTOWER_011284, partial [Ataeniobius toweri]|nr:hypothetical protein [Ataeniobius toweri]
RPGQLNSQPPYTHVDDQTASLPSTHHPEAFSLALFTSQVISEVLPMCFKCSTIIPVHKKSESTLMAKF